MSGAGTRRSRGTRCIRSGCRRARFFLPLVLAGCLVPGPASTRSPAIGFSDDAEFALVVRGDTTVVEEYRRTPALLEGWVRPRVVGASFGWARYRVFFGSTGDVERAELHLGRVGTSTDPDRAPDWEVAIRDGVLEEKRPGGSPRRTSVREGAVPVFAPSIGMTHEVIRQAILRGGRHGSRQIPLYPMATGQDALLLDVSWPAPDTAVLAYPGGPGLRIHVDLQGRMGGGVTSDGEHITVRRR